MTDAVLQADYRFAKPVPTRSCYVLQIEVPWEQFDQVNTVLGAPPKPGENRWVAIARLADHFPDSTKMVKFSEHKEKSPHGDYAAKLYKSGFFLNEEVCLALGSDEKYRKWIQEQPSCVSGKQDCVEFDGGGAMLCEAAHVRRAYNSGVGIKPEYSCVPLTHDEHALQHQKGESELLSQMKPRTHSRVTEKWGVEHAKDWFWQKRCHYLQEWAKGRLKEKLGKASLADCSPADIRQWAEENDLTRYLPKE